jgi:hypothetical protein
MGGSIFGFLTGETGKYNKFIKKGGLWAEYATLLSCLLVENRTLSEEIEDNIIRLSKKYSSGYEQYVMCFTDSQILIVWEMSSEKFGSSSLEWRVYRDTDQRSLAYKISSEALSRKMRIIS